jgi:heme A synthase
MKTVAYIFPVTAFVVFLQAITGAATALNFYGYDAHMMTGYVVAALALVSTAIAFVTKPKYNALRYSSLVLFALVLIQGGIGFLAKTSDPLVVVHFVNFLILFGTSIAITFYAFRWGRTPAAPAMPVQP